VCTKANELIEIVDEFCDSGQIQVTSYNNNDNNNDNNNTENNVYSTPR